MKYNLHTHSHYSDGKLQIEDHIKEAIALNFDVIGMSDHAPLPFDTYFSMKEDQLEQYVAELTEMKQKYDGQIEVFASLEMDYISGLSLNFDDYRKKASLDYLIGSVHLVGKGKEDLWFIDGPKQEKYDEGLHEFFKGDIRSAVKTYYHQIQEMIASQHFEIIGHMDKIHMHNQERFFSIKDKWYRDLYMEVLEQILAKDIVMEVNTRGLYKGRSTDTFPNMDVLLEAQKMGIPVCISSDAHHPSELEKEFEYAQARIRIAKFGEHYCYTKDGFKAVALY